jgi:hypothetical protein
VGWLIIGALSTHKNQADDRSVIERLNREAPWNWSTPSSFSWPESAGRGRYCVREFQRDFIGATPAEIYKLIFEVDELDPVALDYRTDVPRLGELNAQLQQLMKEQSPEHERIQSLQTKIDYIERAKTDEQKQVNLTSLERENVQLRRQLGELRSSGSSSEASA